MLITKKKRWININCNYYLNHIFSYIYIFDIWYFDMKFLVVKEFIYIYIYIYIYTVYVVKRLYLCITIYIKFYTKVRYCNFKRNHINLYICLYDSFSLPLFVCADIRQPLNGSRFSKTLLFTSHIHEYNTNTLSYMQQAEHFHLSTWGSSHSAHTIQPIKVWHCFMAATRLIVRL